MMLLDDQLLQIKKKIILGGLQLILRQGLVQGINLIGMVLFARLLAPKDFGLYVVIIFILNFLLAFSDVGLAASLVRRGGSVSKREYSTVFTSQLSLTIIVSGLVWNFSPNIAEAYKLNADGIFVFRLLSITILLNSFSTIPTVGLERALRFSTLAWVEVLQSFTFNLISIILIIKGYGIISFSVAFVFRSLIGLIILNYVSNIKYGLAWDIEYIFKNISFGLHYQGVKIISLIKDSITPIFIGIMVSAEAVGYLNWASINASYPVMGLFVLQRLYLPAFSKFLDNKRILSKLVEEVIWATNTFAAPMAILTLALIVPIIGLVFGDKWMPALPLFICFWFSNIFVPSVTPCMGLNDAMGLSKLNFYFTVGWMLGTWIIGLPMLFLWGVEGFAFSNIIIQLSNIFLFKISMKSMNLKIISNIYISWLVAIIVGSSLWLFSNLREPRNITELIMYGISGFILYLFIIIKTQKNRLKKFTHLIKL